MSERVTRDDRTWTLIPREESVHDPERVVTLPEIVGATEFARDLGQCVQGTPTLRVVLAKTSLARDVSALDDEEVHSEFGWEIHTRRVLVEARREELGGGGGGGGDGPDPVDPVDPPVPPVEEDTWIEVQLKNTEGVPQRGERYKLKLSDGTVREGSLNEAGAVRLEGIDAGICELTFPDLDRRMAQRQSEAQ